MDTKRVAIYVRVSTKEQAEEGYSVGAQLEKARLYCQSRDWIIAKEYVDGGFSGGDLERPAMQNLIKDIDTGSFDMVLVYKLDRLSRSQKDTLYLIEEVFHPHNIKFTSMQENFDTSTPLGMAMVGILSVFAQLERAQIKERMSMGREARASEGLWHGGTTPVGYDYIREQNMLVINPYEAIQVQKIYEMYLAGETVHAITQFMHANYVNKYSSYKSSKVIYQILDNEIYTGKINHNGEQIVGSHEAIIDQETFNLVQKMRKTKTTQPTTSPFAPSSLLAGLLVCGKCGSKFFKSTSYSKSKTKTTKYFNYRCYAKVGHRLAKTTEKCNSRSYRLNELESLIIEQIKELSLGTSNSKPIQVSEDNEIDILMREKESIDRQILKILDLYSLGTIPADMISKKVQGLEDSKKKIEEQICVLKEQKDSINLEEVKEKLLTAPEIFEYGSFSEQRALVTYLIKEIVLDDDDIEIRWSFM